jgi:hypothetical protein
MTKSLYTLPKHNVPADRWNTVAQAIAGEFGR